MNADAEQGRAPLLAKRRRSIIELIASGFFIVLPILLAGLVLERVYALLRELFLPVFDAMPGVVFRTPAVRFLVLVLALVALLLLIGRLARTRAGMAFGQWLERKVLNRLPFYTMLRNLASGLQGRDDDQSLRPVLVEVDIPGLRQLGFIVERYADGSATVFLPSSPNPAQGTVVIVERARLRELSVPAHMIFGALTRWGQGTAALLNQDKERTGKETE